VRVENRADSVNSASSAISGKGPTDSLVLRDWTSALFVIRGTRAGWVIRVREGVDINP